jgi:YgiT-type zinc finger domain-containing protein
MICPICKCGHTVPGFASVTLERDTMTLLFKRVPAQVCDNCGEEFIDETASANLLDTAEVAARNGVQVELRRYAAA